ncbi:hypothetical protein D0863_02322 [Hortaea werneckii]|uniref:Allantoin permease n=1 Tax=Hortaea werneckii TaxID=91943 RepID=A0A3M7EIB4_HORWE|nr:hypothetical protein D0863_02322 [Hortaea werneckii]
MMRPPELTAMTVPLRHRFESTKNDLKQKRKLSGWVLPKQTTTFADPDKWSNIDADVTPVERRTWTSLTILGFWISDALNAQGWEAPSSIIALGLTWREAVYCIILGSLIDTIPLVLNGAIGAHLHVPFPVAARSSFGFYLARFAVVVRMITALFWHAIQTWTGSMAMAQCIRAIWPSYLDIPNTIPTSVGASSQDLIAHFVFWSVQFPILLTPPHKLKWFFWFKSIVVVSVSVATVIAMTQKAGGAGDIWKQEYQVHGSTRSWMVMSSMMSITGGWATMATNIPDFTRYLRKPEGIYWQALFLPVIKLVVAMFGIICTSSAKVVYGEYIWDPLTLAAQWDGPAGRCGAFFVGFAWVVAQIGTNLSANVISASNDLVNLFPKYVSIRRGVVVITVTAGWIMVPWKIVNSAQSLMNFMSGLAIFLCPIAAILSTDYWLVKKRAVDVPSLYRRRARYRYDYGCNWRAAVAFLVSYDMYYLYGFASASFVYWGLSYAFPATGTLLEASIHDDPEVMDGLEYRKDDVHMPELSSEIKSPSKTIKESLADHAKANQEDQSVDYGEEDVLCILSPASLLDQTEPEQRREVVTEPTNEERRDDRQQVIEERNGLRDDPADNGANTNDDDPDEPACEGVGVLDRRAVPYTVDDITTDDGAVDRTGDEDHREGNTECDARDGATSRQQRWALDISSDESVDQGAGQGVDEDFRKSEGPDGLDVVLWPVHLAHERELTDGEGVGEDNVRHRHERAVEGDILRWPRTPVDSAHASRLAASANTSRDDGDQDGCDNGYEVDVTEPSEFRESRREGNGEKDDRGDDGPDQGADTGLRDNVDEGDRSSEGVGADQKCQVHGEHGAHEFVSEATPDEPDSICIVLNVRVPELDLTDDVGGVNGDKAHANGGDNASNHAQGGESAGKREGTQGNGLDDKTQSQVLPGQLGELGLSLMDGRNLERVLILLLLTLLRVVEGVHRLLVARRAVVGHFGSLMLRAG